MSAPSIVSIHSLVDDERCFETVRQMRWPDGVRCVHCDGIEVTKQGRDDTASFRQRYFCKSCERKFDDLTGTVFAGHHQPLKVWLVCLSLMGLNVSNRQIALELGIHPDDAQKMTTQLRNGIVVNAPAAKLEGEVESDEVYLVAGHKGHPESVKKKSANLDDDG